MDFHDESGDIFIVSSGTLARNEWKCLSEDVRYNPVENIVEIDCIMSITMIIQVRNNNNNR